MSNWEVHAVKYAERNERVRGDSFIIDDNHDAPHAMDYYIWVLRRAGRVIVVDTGYDEAEATARGRPIILPPQLALKPLGIDPATVSDVIVTHLHYDHAGGLHLFPNAHLHMQAAEMTYATGPCMCHDHLRAPFSAGHVCEAVKRVYTGKMTFYEGDGEIAEGITVHCIGGHSRGLQCVRVRTAAGWLVLASDAAHYFENVYAGKPFPIVVDMQNMLDGFTRLNALASSPELIVPGHDPMVRALYPSDVAPHIFRLDHGPNRDPRAEVTPQS
ncbi:N-acyl homoserine lactonase family protein [Celeribacter sp.]|uniref:N-acyl homoserine lactonase family protein n=1 Tax=Celeribacter sp. TaxID=1890673 RepID=UPI003A9078D6